MHASPHTYPHMTQRPFYGAKSVWIASEANIHTCALLQAYSKFLGRKLPRPDQWKRIFQDKGSWFEACHERSNIDIPSDLFCRISSARSILIQESNSQRLSAVVRPKNIKKNYETSPSLAHMIRENKKILRKQKKWVCRQASFQESTSPDGCPVIT